MGPFGSCAEVYTEAGLCIVPCGGEHGKQPLINFKHLRRPWKAQSLAPLLKRHHDANVGILTGPSNLTVVDIDEPTLADAMELRFGPTPIKVRTPRGGLHLWYNGRIDRSTNLRPEFAVDIKSTGGMIIAPPSLSPPGGHYEFLGQQLEALSLLPRFRSEALRATKGNGTLPLGRATRDVRVGERNDFLFDRALHHARWVDDFDTLLDAVTSENDCLSEPLGEAEVRKIAASAWRYQLEGRNWIGNEARAIVSRGAFNELADDVSALALWVRLQFDHRQRRNFAISPKAMAKAQVIPGWSHVRYANARDALLERGFINRIHRGGSKRGDADAFVFAK